jgi:hypothetical protein
MKVNRYLEAFKESHNLVGLTTAAAAAMALFGTPLMPIPLLIGAVAELAYLLFYADSRWYELRLAQKFDAEVQKRRDELKAQVLPALDGGMQIRFGRLEQMRSEIGKQAENDAQWYREVLRKLDFLLEKFLHFALKEAQFRQYLQQVREEVRRDTRGLSSSASSDAMSTRTLAGNGPRAPLRAIRGGRDAGNAISGTGKDTSTPARAPLLSADTTDRWIQETTREVQASYDRELQDLTARAQAETDETTRAVLQKRVEVLGRRREFVSKIARIQINLNHQLQLVEETFGLINDEIRARPPEQVLSDIEDVVTQTNTMTQLLDEVAPLERLLAS